MRSYTDINGGFWTACSECERGGNGSAKEKCTCGYQIKRFNGHGCFIGTLMEKYIKEEDKSDD